MQRLVITGKYVRKYIRCNVLVTAQGEDLSVNTRQQSKFYMHQGMLLYKLQLGS